MSAPNNIRVILVDDHTVVRSGLGAVLETCDTIHLVGEASNGEEAVRLCERVRPDVVLMDLLMPKMDGVTATRLIHERWPGVRVIALTSYKEKEYVEGVLKAGATCSRTSPPTSSSPPSSTPWRASRPSRRRPPRCSSRR